MHAAVEKLDLREFESGYSDEGHPGYHPALLLKVWLYAYALGVTSSRRLEQRIREDLAFRYLAAGATRDYWALNEFRKRHGRGINDAFTQVVELARSLGMGKLGQVAIDSTRIAANAAADSAEAIEKLRAERAKIRRRIRRWPRQCRRQTPTKGREWKWPTRLWKNSGSGCSKSRRGSSGSRKRGPRSCRVPMRTAGSCASAKDLCWGTRRRWR